MHARTRVRSVIISNPESCPAEFLAIASVPRANCSLDKSTGVGCGMSRLPAYEEAFDEDDEEEIGDTEEGDIIARLQTVRTGALYEDGSFPAKKTSLYRCANAGAFSIASR